MEKKKWSLFWGVLLAVCLLSGCGSQKQSNASSSAAKPVAAPIEKSAENRTSSDKRSSSSAEEKEVTEQSNMKQEMNFDQIKQGNYSSLLGEWEEIAVSLNRHDGNGNIWVASKGETISISQNKISNESMTLQGGTINDGESKTVSFSERDNALTADTVAGSILWNICFYPKAAAMIGWGEELPASIDNTKDRIVIRTSNNSYVQVFQRNSSTSLKKQDSGDETSNRSAMKLSEIKTGDYSSIRGTWKNALEQEIVVKNNSMSFSDITNFGEAGKITGLDLSIPDWTEPDGTPKRVPYMDDSNLVAAYEQKLVSHEYEGFFSLRSGLPGAAIYISFLPKGVSGDIQEGNNGEDRIVAVGTQNSPTAVPEKCVYYMVNNSK
ncbi:DUF6287 domain-containing protein [Enterococcus hirae]|nr:DUF6287 domain-containing protein [Enterococcus hirae]